MLQAYTVKKHNNKWGPPFKTEIDGHLWVSRRGKNDVS